MKNQNRINFEPFCREFTSRPFCYVTLRKGELSPADVTMRVREIRFDEYYPAVAYLYDEQNTLILSQIQSIERCDGGFLWTCGTDDPLTYAFFDFESEFP